MSEHNVVKAIRDYIDNEEVTVGVCRSPDGSVTVRFDPPAARRIDSTIRDLLTAQDDTARALGRVWQAAQAEPSAEPQEVTSEPQEEPDAPDDAVLIVEESLRTLAEEAAHSGDMDRVALIHRLDCVSPEDWQDRLRRAQQAQEDWALTEAATADLSRQQALTLVSQSM